MKKIRAYWGDNVNGWKMYGIWFFERLYIGWAVVASSSTWLKMKWEVERESK